jgi:hypothetical protein
VRLRQLVLGQDAAWPAELALLDEQHQPVVRVPVTAWGQGQSSAAVSTDAGKALFRLTAGQYHVTAAKEGLRPESVSATVENGTTNRVEIQFKPAPRIVGTVRDPAGRPVAGLNLMLQALAIGCLVTFARQAQEKPALAADWHVATNGELDGLGNESATWDIGSALDGKRKVEPGDTLWIHQGRYKAEPKVGGMGYVVSLAGRDGAPVQVRAWKGQRLLAARQCLHSTAIRLCLTAVRSPA